MSKLKINVAGCPDREATRLIRIAAKAAYYAMDYAFDAQVDVLITDDPGIREYNRTFRDCDTATDVLSFPLQDFYRGHSSVMPELLADADSGSVMLGDIVISAQRARAQAKEFGHGFPRECVYLTVHSMLHLLGYDHTDEGEEKAAMRAREEAVLKKLGLDRPVFG